MDWNNDDKRKMATIVSKVCELEKAYGMPEKDSKSICRALEMWLAEDFTAAQVVYAIERLVKKSVKVPMPDEIRAFLLPEDRKVTVAEYNQALKDYANNGRDAFSPEGRIIKQYREQNEKEDRAIQERRKEISALSDSEFKKISVVVQKTID